MTQQKEPVNNIAALANVGLCMDAMEKAVQRSRHLPGIVSFFGYSGYGKSTAAAYVANRYRAHYIECRSSWNRSALAKHILIEMGLQPARTIADMVDQIAEELAITDRPLIVDEFDHIVNKSAVEIIRDIYEGSGAPILLIGEERLEANLRRWERFHNRVLAWVPAQPTDMADAKLLRDLYCRDVHIADDLLHQIVKVTKGITRRVCINLETAQEFALANGLDTLTLNDWGNGGDIYTGEAVRRKF